MTCYHPLTAYKSRELTSAGKRKMVFKIEDSLNGQELQLPCGQCIGCRLEYSRQWAMRIMHEASLYEDNCFITLTYDDDNLPEYGSLSKGPKSDFTRFMKRLRKHYKSKKIRFYQVGEYGSETLRAHHHACIFNLDFDDKRLHTINNDNNLYRSDTLSDIWTHGHTLVGSLTFESAAYVARYVTKKQTGKQVEQAKKMFGLSPYHRCDIKTGELIEVTPEYATMSRANGIGREWYETYKSDCYPSDNVVVRGKKMQPPRYYDSLYPDIQNIKDKRKAKAKTYRSNQTPERLRIRETIKMAQITQLKRGL